MKRSMRNAVVVASLMVGSGVGIVASTGCATVAGDAVATNRARYAQASDTYTALVRSFTTLMRTDSVSLERANRFEGARISAHIILNEWKQAIDRGQPFRNEDAVLTVLAELSRLYTEKE